MMSKLETCGNLNKTLIFLIGIPTIEIGGDMEIVLSSTPEGVELRRNPSVLKVNALKRIYGIMVEQWFHAINSAAKNTDLIVLSIGSLVAGLSCIEKYPNLKAIIIYTFPFLPTREFAPPGLGGNSESLFRWMNSLKWKIFQYATFNMFTDKINQLRATIDLPAIVLNYEQLIQRIFHKPLNTATIYSTCLISQPSDWQPGDRLVGPIFEDASNDIDVPIGLKEFLQQSTTSKLIYIGMGSMVSVMLAPHQQRVLLNNITTAVNTNQCRAIISLSGFDPSAITALPESEKIFFINENISHDWLFPQLSAVVHHGGAGTTHAGLRHGLPTLIVPFFADQPFNGDRIAINRLGPKPIPFRKLNANKLTRALGDLLIDNYSLYDANVKRASEIMKNEDGLGQCVQLIETELEISS